MSDCISQTITSVSEWERLWKEKPVESIIDESDGLSMLNPEYVWWLEKIKEIGDNAFELIESLKHNSIYDCSASKDTAESDTFRSTEE